MIGLLFKIATANYRILERVAAAALAKLKIPEAKRHNVVAFVETLKKEIVE